MIDLISHIANKSEEVILPLIHGSATYNGRKIKLRKNHHGWYVLRLGNEVEIIREASRRDMKNIKQKTFLGFSFENMIIPFNFENFHRYKYSDSEPLFFYERMVDPWQLIRVARTDNKELIFLHIERDLKIVRLLRTLKEYYENESPLKTISGITPEMIFLFFSYNFLREEVKERQRIQRLMIEEAERKQKIEEMEKTIDGRIRLALHASGATLVSWKEFGSNNVNVVWEISIDGRSHRISSVVRRDTLAMTSDGLGFCASGYDQTQSLKSAPMLAEKYIQDSGGLHITRYENGINDYYDDNNDYDDDY